MRHDRTARLGTWSALEVRQMLRRFGAEPRDLPSVMAGLAVTHQEARRVLTGLQRAGYVRRDPTRRDALRWYRTPAGEACAQAPLGRPLSRARAQRLLQGVLRRVADVNARPHFLCRVTAVGVFGSTSRRSRPSTNSTSWSGLRRSPRPRGPPMWSSVPIATCRTGGCRTCSRATSGPAGANVTWNCISRAGSSTSSSTRSTIRSCGGSGCGWCSWSIRRRQLWGATAPAPIEPSAVLCLGALVAREWFRKTWCTHLLGLSYVEEGALDRGPRSRVERGRIAVHWEGSPDADTPVGPSMRVRFLPPGSPGTPPSDRIARMQHIKENRRPAKRTLPPRLRCRIRVRDRHNAMHYRIDKSPGIPDFC